MSHAYQQPLETVWQGVARGEALARDRVLAAHYAEFRRIARRVLRDDAGLTLAEAATALGVSESTVERRWRGARAWLLAALEAAG